MRKFICVIGIIASLFAAEGLHRFGGFVNAFGGQDGFFYTGALIVSLVSAVFFILAMVGKLSKGMKWLAIICLATSTGIMLLAPMLPVNQQNLVSLFVAFICMFFAPVKKN